MHGLEDLIALYPVKGIIQEGLDAGINEIVISIPELTHELAPILTQLVYCLYELDEIDSEKHSEGLKVLELMNGTETVRNLSRALEAAEEIAEEYLTKTFGHDENGKVTL